jgi:uncharacterized membrane protein YheB (UPF0754 family)
VTTFVLNTPAEAWSFFGDHMFLLLLMPLIGGFIGWVTKVLAIEMMFRPLEFKGIGPIGWQGQIPRRASKFGSQTADMLLGNVIDPAELIDKIDPEALLAQLDEVLGDTFEGIARDVVGPRWDRLPKRVRSLVLARVRTRGPVIATHLMSQVKENLDEMLDLTHIVTERMISDKRILNEYVSGPLGASLDFMKNFGLLFGIIVGGVQMVVFSFTENHWVIPIFGLVVGFFSDWLALQMLLGPTERKRYFGIPWLGKIYQMRDVLVRELGTLAASEMLTPRVIMEAVVDSALSERLYWWLRAEVGDAIDAELGVFRPLVPAAIGSDRYNALRDRVLDSARQRLPEAAGVIETYAAESLDVETTVQKALAKLSNTELALMLRPIFKDDEWVVVMLGGILGFLVGELQVYLLIHLGGL